MSEHNDDLCYCKPGCTGHVHAARIDLEDWARGVLAIDFLGRNSAATSTPKLTTKNRRAAEAIVKQADRQRGERDECDD